MSMLAERRRQVKWSVDPNGLKWSQDSDAIGRKMLEKMGWRGGGIGKNQDGRKDHITASMKFDKSGLGDVATPEREVMLSIRNSFDGVLSGLSAEASDDATHTTDQPPNSNEHETSTSLVAMSKHRTTRFHYRRVIEAKDVRGHAHRFTKDILFGDRESPSKPKHVQKMADDQASASSSTDDKSDNFYGIRTVQSTMSAADYFAAKSKRPLLQQIAEESDIVEEMSNCDEEVLSKKKSKKKDKKLKDIVEEEVEDVVEAEEIVVAENEPKRKKKARS